MKKILSIILLTVILGGAFAGCSPKNEDIATVSEEKVVSITEEASNTSKEETEAGPVTTSKQIKAKTGTYVGKEQDGVMSFKGIKYAEAPRFKAPIMVEESDEVIEAFEYGPSALQFPNNPNEKASYNVMSEDSLNLNIWAQDAGEPEKPVMVYIHGGGCVGGGSADPLYSGQSFAKRDDVVVVVINYRLNAFGFMDLEAFGGEEYKDSTNVGILDQIMALKWVNENISAFGGDPNNVTIFGNSAGAMSASALMVTPQAKGLFHKVIAQSGTLGSLKSKEAARAISKNFVEFAGVSSMDELLALSEKEMSDLANRFTKEYSYAATAIYLPTADGRIIPEDPHGALEDGAASDVKLMIGSTLNELNYWKLYYEGFGDDKALDFLKSQMDANEVEISDSLMWLLSKSFRLLNLKQSSEMRDQTLVNDVVFRMPSIKVAELQAKHNDVYMYLFEHPSTIEGLEACHTIELNFVFNVLDADVGHAGGDQSRIVAEQTQDAWAAFAANGDPSHESIPDWPKYDLETRQTMRIKEEWVVEADPSKKDREFFQKLGLR